MSRRVLITSAGSTTALSVAKALRTENPKASLVGTDIYPARELPSHAYIDTVETIAPYTDANYINQLTDVCRRHTITHLIPILDQEVEKIAKHRDAFEAIGITVCTGSYESIKRCNDKYATIQTLQKAGVAVAPAYLPGDTIPEYSGYFIKPRRGVSSNDCYRVSNKEDITRFCERVEDPMIQQELKGAFHVLDVVADQEHTVTALTARHETQSKAGVGTKAVTVDPAPFASFAQSIVSACAVTGCCNIELFVDGDLLQFVEINPRPSAGCILSAVAGTNTIAIMLDMIDHNQQENSSLPYKAGISMARFWQETYHDGTLVIPNPYDTTR